MTLPSKFHPDDYTILLTLQDSATGTTELRFTSKEAAPVGRAEFLSLRERDMIVAARAIGASNARIVLKHLLPNALAPIIVAATLGIAGAILLEAALSFLGLGVQAPTASWGNMLSAAQSLTVLESMPSLGQRRSPEKTRRRSRTASSA